MKYDKILRKVEEKAGNIEVRRYNLSDMISESYKTLYDCKSDTNMQKLVESHLEDVRKNPTDIDRLSCQLSIIKTAIRMNESGEIKDEELSLPPISRGKRLKESEDKCTKEITENQVTTKLPGSIDNFLQDLAQEYGYFTYKQIMDHPYTDDEIKELRRARIKFMDIAEEGAEDDDPDLVAIVKSVSDIVTKTGKKVDLEKKDETTVVSDDAEDDLLEDTELTSEEVEELTKHLSEIRKNKKVSEGCAKDKKTESKEIKESKGRKLVKRSIAESVEDTVEDNGDLLEDTELTSEEVEELTKHLSEIRKNKKVSEGCAKDKKTESKEIKESKGRKLVKRSIAESVEDTVEDNGELVADKKKDTVEPKKVDESTSWDNVNLSEFNKKSASKAFMKTFKKLDSKLHEGTALTRQESISLYKAANSAMTHLSVELEKNPKFLSTFNEATTLLTSDVNKLLESMKKDKAPSKSTMKSLAKFSEALLNESYLDKFRSMITSDDTLEVMKKIAREAGIDTKEDPTEEEAERLINLYHREETLGESEGKYPMTESDEEDIPDIEDEDMIDTEDPSSSEEFDQEYADARVELHKELADTHANSEDPSVQEKLANDADDIAKLPGITDEKLAELTGDTTDDSTDDSEEDLSIASDDEITEDELSELKNHLREMRKQRK